jgi:transcriptional regulator with PAS, ATPase and Fis domain
LTGSTSKKTKGFDQEAMKTLISYEWPGNARELRNVIERAVILSESDIITESDLPDKVKVKKHVTAQEGSDKSLKSLINCHEKDIIVKTLKQYKGSKELTGKALGIDLATLYRKINKYKIDL